MVSVPSLIINDVIMTPLLLLKIINVLANFMICQTACYFGIFHFMATLRGKIDEVWFLPINSTI